MPSVWVMIRHLHSEQSHSSSFKDVRDRKILHTESSVYQATLCRKSIKKFAVTDEKIFCTAFVMRYEDFPRTGFGKAS